MASPMPRIRHEWRRALPLEAPPKRSDSCAGLKLRRPAQGDAEALGELLLDAYRGTIDYEGEDLAAATGVVRDFFAGKEYPPDIAASVVAWRGPTPAAFCMIAEWQARSCRFVEYVATRSGEKRRGVGRLVLGESLRRLSRAGHPEVRAVITLGNTASDALFRRLGFEDLGPLGPRPGTPPKA